jgi:hypothetical protein
MLLNCRYGSLTSFLQCPLKSPLITPTADMPIGPLFWVNLQLRARVCDNHGVVEATIRCWEKCSNAVIAHLARKIVIGVMIATYQRGIGDPDRP